MTNSEIRFTCGLLGRLLCDCKYYLGYGYRQPRCLWAKDETRHIAKMRELYDSLPESPQWLTREQLDEIAKDMGVIE